MNKPTKATFAQRYIVHCYYTHGYKLNNNKGKTETESREHNREVQESKTEVVWTRKETRPRIRRKKYSGDGTTWEKKKRKTEAEMDGLCQSRHESHQNDERRSP